MRALMSPICRPRMGIDLSLTWPARTLGDPPLGNVQV